MTSEKHTDTEEARTVDRRTLMKAAGTAGIGAVGLGATAGTAAAGETPDQLYFCGCSQLVVTGLGKNSYIDVYLRATDEGGCKAVRVSDPACHVGGGREYAYRYTVEGEEAILAVGTSTGIWCNPNNCAQKWLDELTCFSGITGSLRDACEKSETKLDYPGDVFTNRCGTVCSGGHGGGPPQR